MEFSKETIDKANAAVSTAIMQLMRQRELAFDTSIVLNMPREYTEGDHIMKVKGTKLEINPENFLKLSKNDQQWNIRHTAWHVIGFDEVRKGNRDADRWNLASDLWVNSMLTHDTDFKVQRPADAAYDPQFKDWDKEKIYDFLEQNQQEEQKHKQDPMQGDCGGGSDEGEGDSDQSDGNQPSQGNESSQEQLEKQIQSMVSQAALQAKQAGGKVPNSVEQYLDELYNPKLPWSKLLMKYMNSHNTYDYSYQRIHKKFFPHGIIMPSMYSEGLGPVFFATDESCSVSDEDLKLYLGAIETVLTEFEPESLTVLGFTTQVDHEHTLLTPDDIDKVKFRVHGGTHIPAVFDYIEEKKHNPQVLIVLSDMESAFPKQPPGYDVIWISVNNNRFVPPFGRAVYVTN